VRPLSAVGSLALVILAGELGAWGALRWREARLLGSLPRQASAPLYAGVGWAEEYWREWRACCRVPQSLRHVGDGVLRLRPFEGATINVGADGLRATPESACSQATPTIALFGGSMLWGHGSRDADTIPSLLARRLASKGTPACVLNYGQWWGTSSRSALSELLSELQRRALRPDVVVLYAGSYDVKELVYGSGSAPGSSIGPLLDLPIRAGPGFAYLGFSNLARAFGGSQGHPASASTRAEIEAVRSAVVRQIQDAERLGAALGAAYGFRFVTVWHPYAVAGPKPLTRYEEESVREVETSTPGFAAAIREVYPAVRSVADAAGIHDLSGALSARPEPLYRDAGHLGPAGNAIVAERLVPIVEAALAGR